MNYKTEVAGCLELMKGVPAWPSEVALVAEAVAGDPCFFAPLLLVPGEDSND